MRDTEQGIEPSLPVSLSLSLCRGCLFYGPPGTGKTLVARALANECSHGNRKVAFFMRKGADCLSKWVGESERQLRLLFEQVTQTHLKTHLLPPAGRHSQSSFICVVACRPQAYQMRPSIIFFDEIDGLAPVRSSRQDQIHRSERQAHQTKLQEMKKQNISYRTFFILQLHRVDAPRSDGRVGQPR